MKSLVLLVCLSAILSRISAQPVNDECEGAITLPVNSGVSWSFTAGNNSQGTISLVNSCTNGMHADGWFKFVAQDTAHLFAIQWSATRNAANTNFKIYSGSCGGLVPVTNIKNASGDIVDCMVPGSADIYYRISGLTIGNTYYIDAIDNFPNETTTDSFRIAIGNRAPNDDIAGAINILASSFADCQAVQGNMRNASWGAGPTVTNCELNMNGTDVWYKFTANYTRHLILVTKPDNDAITSPKFELLYFDNGVLTAYRCETQPIFDFTGLIPGNVYYIRVKRNEYFLQDDRFTICVSRPESGPSNTTCIGPTPIHESTGALANAAGAAFTGPPLTDCGTLNSTAPDLWFLFFPGINSTVEIRFIPQFDHVGATIEVYGGNCQLGTMVAVACPPPGGRYKSAIFNAQVPNGAYLIRVIPNGWGFYLFVNSVFGLPVKLTSFEARAINNKSVKIIWKTAEESQIKHYEIERSRNGVNFSSIAKVNSRNSPTPAEYTGDDLSPEVGINYYRLKVVSEDDKIEYSRIERVNFKGRFTDNLQVVRQGNDLLIKNQSNTTKNVSIGVYTATGQRIFSSRKLLTGGVNSFNIPAMNNQALFVKIEMPDGETKTFKVIN